MSAEGEFQGEYEKANKECGGLEGKPREWRGCGLDSFHHTPLITLYHHSLYECLVGPAISMLPNSMAM